MNPQTKDLVYQAESRYLELEELKILEGAVKAMPKRLALYKLIRNQELQILQTVADQLDKFTPPLIENGIKHLLLVMRYAAMAILTDDPNFFQTRLIDWLRQINTQEELRPIASDLYCVLFQTLKKELDSDQMTLIQSYLTEAQAIFST